MFESSSRAHPPVLATETPTASSEPFRDLVADFASWLEAWRRRLSDLEGEVPWPSQVPLFASESSRGVREGGPPEPELSTAQADLLGSIVQSFVPGCAARNEAIDRARRVYPPAEEAIQQQFSRRQVQSLLVEAPWMRRALEKPLGYAGDYQVMRYMYEDQWAGETHFGRALGYAIHQTPAAQAVVARKNLMTRQLRQHSARHRPGKPLRILLVAAGPAQELYEVLTDPRIDLEIEAVLLEQETEALAYAESRLRPVVERRRAPTRIERLQESVRRVVADRHFATQLGRFDVVVSAGLFDYLHPRMARRLITALTSTLAPGGTAYFGNMVPENPCRWIQEHGLDWWLIHRSRDELLDMARSAVPEASCWLLEEATGVNPFVAVSPPLGGGPP